MIHASQRKEKTNQSHGSLLQNLKFHCLEHEADREVRLEYTANNFNESRINFLLYFFIIHLSRETESSQHIPRFFTGGSSSSSESPSSSISSPSESPAYSPSLPMASNSSSSSSSSSSLTAAFVFRAPAAYPRRQHSAAAAAAAGVGWRDKRVPALSAAEAGRRDAAAAGGAGREADEAKRRMAKDAALAAARCMAY